MANINYKTFSESIRPHIPKSKRGPQPKIDEYTIFCLIVFRLKTGIQWRSLSLVINALGLPYSWNSVYRYFRKWCECGMFQNVLIDYLSQSKDLDLSEVYLDGTHTKAHCGGEEVGYQGRKKAKTTNLLYLTDANGKILSISLPIAGNHHDLKDIIEHFKQMYASLKKAGLCFKDVRIHADKGFDSQPFRKHLHNIGMTPNIPENPRNRKKAKSGRKRNFDKASYQKRFRIEQVFAWLDGFKALIIRYEKKANHWLQINYLAAFIRNLKT